MVAIERSVFILLVFLLAACAAQPSTVSSPDSIEAPTLPLPLTQFIDTSIPPATVTPQQSIGVTPTNEPYTGSLAGLIYQDQQGVWKIAEDETPALLFDFQGVEFGLMDLSPNLDKIMYRDSQTHIFGDVVTDIHTGETVQSYYGDYILCWIDWWPAQPNLLLVGLHPADEEEGRACHTVPAIKQWNGPILETLGTEYTFPATKAGSPDGQQVAFDDFFVPWMFTLGQGKERFDYLSYGFPDFDTVSFSDPVWSPSGRWLAWFVFGQNNEEYFQGIAIFDMHARTSNLLAPFEVLGFDGGRGYLEWSLDEKHLLLMNRVKDYLRVFELETEEVVYASDEASDLSAIFSPDGQWITHSEYESETKIRNIVVASLDQTASHTLPHFLLEQWSPGGMHLLIRMDDEVSINHGQFYIFEAATGKYFQTGLPTNIQILAWDAD